MNSRSRVFHFSSRQGFSLVEMLVALAISAGLLAMLLPAFNNVMEKGRQAECSSNLRQIGHGLAGYLRDNDQVFPLAYDTTSAQKPNWQFSLVRGDYMGSPDLRMTSDSALWRPEYYKVMGCPSARKISNKKPPYSPTYAMNGNIADGKLRSTQLSYLSSAWIVMDGPLATSGNYGSVVWSRAGTGSLPGRAHRNEYANILFCDGHVEAQSVDSFVTDDRPGNSPQFYFWNGRPL